MSGTWLVDKIRIASKIKSASASYDQGKVQWKSNPSKSCPNCLFVIDNSDVAHAWPGLPQGVKFDPSDEEIISHLLAKVGVENFKPHPFIDEFIPTIDEDDGICYTHPQNLPGVKPDGTVSHFFHRAIKAYNTGTRKRRKIHGDDSGDVRWHKTGRTKPVLLEGAQKGCKKIMVLYISSVRGGKAEKTNWVMHQYHLGTEEDEKEGQYVISKVSYQKLQLKQVERSEPDVSEGILTSTVKVDPITPQSVTPEPHAERRFTNYELLEDPTFPSLEPHDETIMEIEIESPSAQPNDEDQNNEDYNADIVEDKNDDENNADIVEDKNDDENNADIVEDKNDDEEASEGDKWWENESQFLLSSQQLVEGLSLCDELLQSQSPIREESGNIQGLNSKPRLADYARLGPEDLKRDLEECQNLASDPSDKKSASDPVDTNLADIVLDSIPEFRLSQLEFESQDSYIAWGGSYEGGKVVD